MKIRLSLTHLNEAFDFASTVKPAHKDNISAYLFTVSDGRCFIHSQDDSNYVRTEVPVISIEGDEASFVYPADRVDALKYLDGWIDLESGEDGGRPWTSHRTEGGAKAHRSTFNSRVFNTRDDAVAEAASEYSFPTILLKEGLSVTSKYTAPNPSDSESHLSCIQLFDKSNPDWAAGDGVMYATNSQRACYFHCPELAGKGFAIQDKHVPRLASFLNKCQKQVKMKVGRSMIFVIDQVPDEQGALQDGTVFGWTMHAKTHQRYKYLPSKHDKVCMRVTRDVLVKALKYVKSEMKDLKREKIRIVYQKPNLKFLSAVNKEQAEGVPVGITPLNLEDGVESASEFAANVDVDAFLGLFESSREPEVELRVAFTKDQKAFFRTVGKVFIGDSGKTYISSADAKDKEDVHECLVTHFTTSMD